ncbi:hypothetical protein KP79_PYT16115 [Mizuhopecten yessoensis]|uniref:Uncharacterized protein n=1 Tax=Mizuhopecten yessoensis TaxID=6573 RepID=A0A210QD78_MIZYE|nr:hypothetical protein KP79_PYT16115 [Mizuhopecten yessoensis]
MEVVLWKPPGDFAKGLAPKSEFCWKGEDSVGNSNMMRSCDQTITRPSVQETLYKQSEESVTMDTELFDDLDDDMQL